MTKGYVDTLGKSLYKHTGRELVQLYKKVVEMEASNKVVIIPYDTHKDIQLIENEFVRRFKKLDDYIEKEKEYKEIELQDRQDRRRKGRTL